MNEKDMMSSASSPGKFILLGEHAVVYGKPAMALAIDKRFRCRISRSDRNILNGLDLEIQKHPHIGYVMSCNDIDGLNIETETEIPGSSGLGSSAALCTALSAAIKKLQGKVIDKCRIAEEAFGAEYFAQGRASPMDTSCSTFGNGVAINCPSDYGTELMTIYRTENKWSIHQVPIPKMTFVVGYTGIKAPTGPLVAKVRKYKEHNRFASDIIDEIETITLEGMKAVKNNDIVKLGKLMTQDHKLLSILGVSCNELNKLVNASMEYSYGAKLTGSGGGGSMIALTDQPEKVCRAIELHGGIPYTITTGADGVRIE